MKTCSKCKVEKPISEYHTDKNKPDGYRYECKECKRAQLRASYYKHREARKAKSKEKNNQAKAK